MSIRKEAAAEKALRRRAVENSLGSSDSSLAMSLVKTLLIPKSENKDIKPNIERAAE